ncbi:MFS general substrate transporter [Hyphopichia burtonii NRRL Y-1933]|uniref:MFS general substrate transporter n=1 Tax=Hyphopichia burtonii NRRL Y-1933 TaxID=984485 RepID=A0A1E4RIC3_9ASCO|nr:MFS general substrate transporter [Hyphopichia burtonii NRRL Y-1933]ODV66990.1 MFS general substrate transporter [Hyphopichia burtonii NRRL Y-1933]
MQYAYTAGLKEAFHLSGTDYNWIDNGYYICYAVGGLLGVLLTAYFPPRIVFPSFELSWVVFTILNCIAHDFTSQLVLRCFQGGLAGMAFPSISYILGTFYPPELLSSRTSIFIFAGCVGPIIGGIIQSGLYGALEGKHIGIPAFKMAQVVDGLIGLPVAISGFFVIPPVTGDKGNFYLSREDIQHLFKRTEQSSEQTHNKFNLKFIWSVLTSWQLWLFCLLFSAEQIAEYAASFQSIVLQSQGYSVYQCNNLPTIQSGVKAVATLAAGVLIELKGKRFEVYLLICAIWITGLAILVKYDVARIAQFIGYALTGVCSPVSAILLSWANTASRNRGAGFRAFVLGSLNIAAQICLTPIGVIIFDTSLAPRFTTGMRLGLAMVVLQVFGACALLWCDRYERRLADLIDELSTELDEKL